MVFYRESTIALAHQKLNIKMQFVSSKKMRNIDRLATEHFGIPSLLLMENAGRSVADEAEKMLHRQKAKVIIFCGYGNNGGDGFVVARHLINRGYDVRIFLVGKEKPMSSDTKINSEILKKMKTRFKKIKLSAQIKFIDKEINNTKLIIDAIFGIGIKGRLDEFYCQLFKKIKDAKILVLSIDIPSGLDADKGIALPIAIKAKRTVTMGILKKGFLSSAAMKYLGDVCIGDISLPRQLR